MRRVFDPELGKANYKAIYRMFLTCNTTVPLYKKKRKVLALILKMLILKFNVEQKVQILVLN